MFAVTLSFDNGPEPDVTPAVLDVLAARHLRTTFFVIGAPKCGTTSLYHYLGAHPEIHMSPIKEPAFFLAPDPERVVLRARDTPSPAGEAALRDSRRSARRTSGRSSPSPGPASS